MAMRLPASSKVRGQPSPCPGFACPGFACAGFACPGFACAGVGCATTTIVGGRAGTAAGGGGSELEHDAHEHSAAMADATNRNRLLIPHLPVPHHRRLPASAPPAAHVAKNSSL